MRRKSKLFIAMILFGLTTTGCNFLPSPVNRPNARSSIQQVEDNDFEEKTREIYNLYLAQGGTMSYEDWLESVRGQDGKDGQDGATPYIGSNGNWYIDGRDTGVKAAGSDGLTPFIGANGNWWIGERDTGVSTQGESGSGIASISI